MLIGIALIAVVLVSYPQRVRHLSPGWRRTMIGLRLLTALLLCFAMFRPAVRFTTTDTDPAELLIVTDTSASMATPDSPGGISRRAALLKTLSDAEPILKELSEKVDIRFVDFAQEPVSVDVPAETADGQFTAIGATIDELRREDAGKRLFGVILMGDGAERAVPPFDLDARTAARRFAEQLGVPIHTVTYGTSDLSAAGLDLAVDDLLIDPVTFEKKTVPVRASVRLLGAAGRKVRVQLLREDRAGLQPGQTGELQPIPFVSGSKPAEEFTPQSNDETRTVDLSLVADVPGEYKIAVEAVPLEGEIKTTNNRLQTLLTVRKGGLKVAYFDTLRPEGKFLEKLNRTAKIQLDWQVVLPGRLASRTEILPTMFDPGQYDVYVIGDVPASAFRQGQSDLLLKLADRVSEGSGLLMIGGQRAFGPGGYGATRLADLLPVEMSASEAVADDAINPDAQYDRKLRMLPTRSGSLQHYVMNVDPRDNASAWEDLPPLLGANRLAPKIAADVLAATPDDIPLLMAADTGRGRTMAFAADSTWMWHMRGHEHVHQRFWQQMILWLARKELEGDQPVWVLVDPRNYAPQSEVTATFGARDDQGQPIDDATFGVKVIDPDGEEQTLTPQRSSTQNFALFDGTQTPGDYWVTVTAERGGTSVGLPATTRFIVDPRDLELDNPAADPDLMGEIAALTGTSAIAPEDVPSFLENLLNAGLTTELTQHTQINLWDNWPLLLVFVLLLASEWFLRKRRGLV
jgi:uncharacterized membrane protein